MAFNDPRDGLHPLVWCALLTAFGSATQDIALDAFRIESAETRKQAALAAAYQTGYRLAMIWAGAGVLWVAAWAEVAPAAAVTGAAAYQNGAWKTAYLVMAASMAVGVLTVLEGKWLEFDGVVVVEPAEMAAESVRGGNDLYVAITRATQRLHVLHASPLPPGLEQG